RRAGRALLLRPLVALDAARVVVFGLALLPGELDAVDAAVALVEHREIVDDAAAEARAARRVGTDPIEVRRNELLVLRAHRRRQAGRANGQRRKDCCGAIHQNLLLRMFRIAKRQYSPFPIVVYPAARLVRERPQPQLLLGDLPEPCEAEGLDDQ